MIWTSAFWKAVAERAISTVAQVAVGMLTATTVPGTSTPWQALGVAIAVAALLSVLKSLIVNQATGTGPSAVSAETIKPAA